jgi:TonB family protein
MKISTIILLLFVYNVKAQNSDAEIKELLNANSASPRDSGTNLIINGQFQQAGQYYSTSINKDESDRQAYFRRGVANWGMSDTVSACRDWSSVLALGDTAMFLLLESKCHSTMIIEDDSIPAKQYKKTFAGGDNPKKNAMTVVEIMPEFPGGQENLFQYLFEHTPKIKEGKKGTVYVNFVVSPKGKILFPYVTRGLGVNYDKAAIQLVKNMPPWQPGRQKGKPVYVKTVMPVRF